jgi:choline kinase
MRALAVLVAAGQGARLGGPIPKGLVRLRGRSLVE